MEPIRLLLVDDHVLFREGVSRLLATEPGFAAVAQCGTAEEALAVVARTPIDIVLLDYDPESETGTRFISDASARGFQGKTLMVAAGMNEHQCSLAWKLGISGVVMKHTSPAKLFEAIRKVAAGGIWSEEAPISRVGNPSGAKAALLTPRERQVLRGVLEGQTNRDIAYSLGASLGSVKAAVQQLFGKTGVRTRSQLVRIAFERSNRDGSRTADAGLAMKRATGFALRTALVLHSCALLAQPALAGEFLSGADHAVRFHEWLAWAILGLCSIQIVLAAFGLRTGVATYWLLIGSALLLLAESLQTGVGYGRFLRVHIPLGVIEFAVVVVQTVSVFRPRAGSPE